MYKTNFLFLLIKTKNRQPLRVSGFFRFLLFYSALIALTGHPSSQAPQSTHSSVIT